MTHSFDQLVDQVNEHSFDGDRRRYHRFRFSSHDNAAVADCIGSNLRCAHEWGWCEGILDSPDSGQLYSPEEVIDRLQELADEHGTERVRLSGMEPVMADKHLLTIADHLPSRYQLRIDTNGMLLSQQYLERLTDRHDDLRIRLSFKGADPATFSKLARVGPQQFERQLDAYRACSVQGIETATVLAGVYTREEKQELRERLEAIDSDMAAGLELEDLRLCPANVQQLEQAGFDVDRFTG